MKTKKSNGNSYINMNTAPDKLNKVLYMKEIGHRSNATISNQLNLAYSTVSKVRAGRPALFS